MKDMPGGQVSPAPRRDTEPKLVSCATTQNVANLAKPSCPPLRGPTGGVPTGGLARFTAVSSLAPFLLTSPCTVPILVHSPLYASSIHQAQGEGNHRPAISSPSTPLSLRESLRALQSMLSCIR